MRPLPAKISPPGPSAPAERSPRWKPRWRPSLLILGLGLFAVLFFSVTRDRTDVGTIEAQTAEISANDLVARAREYFDQHRREDNERAIQLFERALAKEPDHSPALAGLSLAYSQRTAKFHQPMRWATRAESLARRAIEDDATLAEAHHALGLAFDAQGRLDQALESYRRAYDLDENHLRALGSGAYVLAVLGQHAEALEWNLRLLAQNAQLPYLEIQIADSLAALDFLPSAESWYDKAWTLRPDNLFAGVAYAGFRARQGDLQGAGQIVAEAQRQGVQRAELAELLGHLAALRGNEGEAHEHYALAVEMNPRSAAVIRRLVLEIRRDEAGKEEEARALAEGLQSDFAAGNQWPPSAVELAILQLALGSQEEALSSLELAVDLGYRSSQWLIVDPALAALRNEAGFWRMIERIRELNRQQRDRVLRAPWLPAGFLDAAR